MGENIIGMDDVEILDVYYNTQTKSTTVYYFYNNNTDVLRTKKINNLSLEEVRQMARKYNSYFETNNEKSIFINENELCHNILKNILETRNGKMYDKEELDFQVNNYLKPYISIIKQKVDKKMEKYLEEDNLTVNYNG